MVKVKVDSLKLCRALEKFRRSNLDMSLRDYEKQIGLTYMTLYRLERRIPLGVRHVLILMYQAGLKIEDFIIEEELEERHGNANV